MRDAELEMIDTHTADYLDFDLAPYITANLWRVTSEKHPLGSDCLCQTYAGLRSRVTPGQGRSTQRNKGGPSYFGREPRFEPSTCLSEQTPKLRTQHSDQR